MVRVESSGRSLRPVERMTHALCALCERSVKIGVASAAVVYNFCLTAIMRCGGWSWKLPRHKTTAQPPTGSFVFVSSGSLRKLVLTVISVGFTSASSRARLACQQHTTSLIMTISAAWMLTPAAAHHLSLLIQIGCNVYARMGATTRSPDCALSGRPVLIELAQFNVKRFGMLCRGCNRLRIVICRAWERERDSQLGGQAPKRAITCQTWRH